MSRKRLTSSRLLLESLEDRIVPSGMPSPLLDLGGLVADANSYAPARILVRFQSESVPLNVLPAGASLGSALALVPGLYQIQLDSTLSVEAALAAFRGNSAVAFAEPDYLVHADFIPNDPSLSLLWGLNNTGQSGGTVDADIDGPEAWNTATGSGSVTVAIIDTGIDYNHPDLAANIWTNSGEIAGNGIDDDHNGYVDDLHGYDWVNNDGDPMDDNSHGTHVAGTIGAVGNNGIGVAGVDWNVRLMALKFLDASGNGYTSNAVQALNYAVTMGASISNNSWGGGGFDQSMVNALTNARSHGHIFVAAAGNNGTNNDTTPFYPANYDLDNVVSVAATDRFDQLASFSNYGASTVDLAAPGYSIYSTLPGGSYGYKSGTSMATPHVTGALALLRDVHPDWSYSQLISQILSTADPLASLQGKTVTGGRLNIGAALAASPSADVTGARVTASSTLGSSSAVTGMRLTFSEAIDPASFTSADAVLTGPGGGVSISGVAAVSGSGNTQFDVTFAAQTAAGAYQLAAGPDVRDAAGNAMDQNQNGVNGEATADQYTTAFTINPPADTTGAHVTGSSPLGSSTAVNGVRLTFSEALDPATFTAADASLTGPAGGLTISGVAPVSGTGNTQFDVTFATQTTAGAYQLVVGPDVRDTAGNPMDQNQNGTNGETTADQYTTAFPVYGLQTFSSGDIPRPINDLQTTVSTLTIGQDVNIVNLKVRLNISHTADGNLYITLHSPTGTVVVLSNRQGGKGDNFQDTVFDDQGTQSVSVGSAPFAGTYRPEAPLSALNGQNARGTWQLWVADQLKRDQGTLNSWSLTITTGNGGAAAAKESRVAGGKAQAGPSAPGFSTVTETQTALPSWAALAAISPGLPSAAEFVGTGTGIVPLLAARSDQQTCFGALDHRLATLGTQGSQQCTVPGHGSAADRDLFWIALGLDQSQEDSFGRLR